MDRYYRQYGTNRYYWRHGIHWMDRTNRQSWRYGSHWMDRYYRHYGYYW